MSVINSSLPVLQQRAMTPTEVELLVAAHSRASWIWISEESQFCSIEQRAFRKTFYYPPNRRNPTSATIVIGADDYFTMYVDGVLVHSGSLENHDWRSLVAFHVPLPIVSGTRTDIVGDLNSLLLAFRVVNKDGPAGLLVAVQVHFEDGDPPEVFYTGQDQSWLAEPLMDEHWEHPMFNPIFLEVGWKPAKVYSGSELEPFSGVVMEREVVTVMGPLSLISAKPLTPSGESTLSEPTCTSTFLSGPGTARSGTVVLSMGAFAGGTVGLFVGACFIGMVIGFILSERRKKSRSKANIPRPLPNTLPGRRLVYACD